MTRQLFGIRASLCLTVLLGLALIAPVWADDDNNKKPVETSNEVDCEDKDNAGLPECLPVTQPGTQLVVTEEAPPAQTESAPAAPRPTGSELYKGHASDIVFKQIDAGKEAVTARSEDGSDAKGTWARGRYERRDDDGSSDSLGPRVIDHMIYVTNTIDQAKQLFKDEAAKNERFPEQNARDERRGFFKFDIKNMVEQTAAVSACNDCGGKEQIMLHHRIVQQRANIVSVLYLYGRDKRAAEDIVSQKRAEELWAYEVSLRI